jgi:hypothetical protein
MYQSFPPPPAFGATDTMATLASGQPMSVGSTAWFLTAKFTGQQGNFGFIGSKEGGRLICNYQLSIGGVMVTGSFLSTGNPFIEGALRFKLGVQFSGSLGGSDVFQANLYQFETQQRK